MKQELERTKPLSEKDAQAFLNEDPQLSQSGRIQWRRTGIWRWESSDGLAFATSDGRTVETGWTARGEALEVSLRK
jgi:hypothetical protein